MELLLVWDLQQWQSPPIGVMFTLLVAHQHQMVGLHSLGLTITFRSPAAQQAFRATARIFILQRPTVQPLHVQLVICAITASLSPEM